jgi:hypothetical protein
LDFLRPGVAGVGLDVVRDHDRTRQMAGQSTDGMKTSTMIWDSYYVRKGAAK